MNALRNTKYGTLGRFLWEVKTEQGLDGREEVSQAGVGEDHSRQGDS